jgi:hypothetical protein
MLRLSAAVLLAASLSAQSTPGDQNELSRVANNPYDLARFVDSQLGFDWGPLWKALRTEPRFIQPCGKLTDGKKHCSTELITVLDPDQVIVLIQGDLTPADVYLRYLKEKTGRWHFVGAHESYVHNHPRRHEVDRSTGKPFLRISSQGIRGSDVDSEVENWFDLSQPGFEPVFSFTVQGNQRRVFGIGRRIFQTAVADKDTLDVVLQVEYFGAAATLGDAEYNAVYVRGPGAKRFNFQAAFAGFGDKAKIPKAAFEELADLDEGPSNEDLIGYTMPRLKEIAAGGDGEAKEWLKHFLDSVNATPEALELRALLH